MPISIFGGVEENEHDVELWRHHLEDEADAAYLYRVLAEVEPDPNVGEIYRGLAEVEDRHTQMWQELFAERGIEVARPEPSRQSRLLGWLARRFSPSLLLPLLLREEGREVVGYLDLYQSTPAGTSTGDTAQTLARESAKHAYTLSRLSGKTGEPWHNTRSGGFLGNVVYGFNDGLTANFGLVAGVIGAAADAHEIILVTGLAGMVADALSMGSSGYLASKSEQEVHSHEIAKERREIELMPDVEEEELSLIYQARGLTEERARELAHETIQVPDRALDELVREELGIVEAHTTPLREGWITGVATAVGALIPVAPFLFTRGPTAIWLSFTLAMFSHFAVGAARSLFTGRKFLRSGLEMFAVGIGVAAAGYVVGDLVMRLL